VSHQEANISAAPVIAQSGTFRSTQPVPPIVEAAFWLVIAGGALSVVVLVLRLVLAGWNAPGDHVVALVTWVIGGAIGIGIRIGVAVILRRGYWPARIFLTVGAAISLGPALLNGVDPIGAVLLATVVSAVVLVWLPPANRYYRAVTEERKQSRANGGGSVGFLG
jgi:hypothetical protein